MSLSKSIDFLLENAGPVIVYRLHTEILRDVSKAEEEGLLEKVYATPKFKLLESYVKSNGYIGSGMHNWDNWGGKVLHKTPLQDGEAAARLISNYSIPKTHPIAANFARALQDESILEKEFSYIPPEVERFKNRHIGIQSGFSLQLLIDTCLALMGYGDDGCVEETKRISYNAFISLLDIESLNEITKTRVSKQKYNYPYVEADTYLPCVYHLQTLSHTKSWRTSETLAKMAAALNHQGKITRDGTNIHTKIRNNYYAPLWALREPIKSFERNRRDTCYRRVLTDIAMMGIGRQVDVTKISAERLYDELSHDGVLRTDFASSYEKRVYKQNNGFPTPYSEVQLEQDAKSDHHLWCDLTFWAVQFLTLYEERGE